MEAEHSEHCRSCGAPVIFATHSSSGKVQPLELVSEADAPEHGTFILVPAGGWFLYMPAGPADPWPRYRSHFATCPQADQWRTVTVREHTRVVGPRARRTDPSTSHQAAASAAPNSGTLAERLLRIFAAAKRPITDEELAERHARIFPGVPATAAGIRTRRSELERAGLVAVTDADGRTSSGRACRRYGITRLGMDTTKRESEQ